MKGGVLIIGSLLWQKGSTKQPWDNARQAWRERYLDLSKKILVSVPIRYGGYSTLREVPVRLENPRLPPGQALTTNILTEAASATSPARSYLVPAFETGLYTMVFSTAYDTVALRGKAWLCPLKEEVTDLPGVWEQVKALAKAEGIFYSDKTYFNKSWGAITALIRPGLAQAEAMRAKWVEKTQWRDEQEREKWSKEHPGSLEEYVPYVQKFRLGKDARRKGERDEQERSCLTEGGLLNIAELLTIEGQNVFDADPSGPAYDFVLTSVTLPRLAPQAERDRYPTPIEIGAFAQVDMRRYFQNNFAEGITTHDDEAIWRRVGFGPSPAATHPVVPTPQSASHPVAPAPQPAGHPVAPAPRWNILPVSPLDAELKKLEDQKSGANPTAQYNDAADL